MCKRLLNKNTSAHGTTILPRRSAKDHVHTIINKYSDHSEPSAIFFKKCRTYITKESSSVKSRNVNWSSYVAYI